MVKAKKSTKDSRGILCKMVELPGTLGKREKNATQTSKIIVFMSKKYFSVQPLAKTASRMYNKWCV